MPSSFSAESPRGRLAGGLVVLAIATAGTWLLYHHTLDYGFDYDDYQFTKPFTAAEIRDAFQGPWDRTGIQVPFFRPLTIAFYAARFELFGVNAYGHHALSLLLFSIATIGAGLVGWGMSGRLGGALSALFFVVHPSMPYAQAVWPTNQMHLAESVVVLTALLWWHAVRARRLVWWLPLLAAQVAAFLLKEDGVMLLPVVVTLHWLRRRLAEPSLPPVPRPFIALGVVVLASLLAVRTEALHGLGGYAPPSSERAVWNFVAGLDRVFRLVPADRPWQQVASWFATLTPLAGFSCWRGAAPHTRFMLLSGCAIAILFNLPFVFVTKVEQMHLVALGAALVLAASVLAIAHVMRLPALRITLAIGVGAGAASMAAVSRDISTDFEPFGPVVLAHDRIVEGWTAVPDDLRRYLARKRELSAMPANPADALDLVVFGAHPPETNPSGLQVRWMSSAQTELLVTVKAREVSIPLRHEAGVFQEPAVVEVVANGRRVDAMQLHDGAWKMSRVALRTTDAPRFWRMHRLTIRLQRAWVPARIIRGAADTRVLGLQIGAVEIK